MNRMKRILKLGIILTVVGVMFTVTSLNLGVNASLYWDNGFRIGTSGAGRTLVDETLPAFEQIELNLPVASVTLRSGDEFRITGHHYGVLRYEAGIGTLRIFAVEGEAPAAPLFQVGRTERAEGYFLPPASRFQLGGSDNVGVDLTIYVPGHVRLQDVQLDLGVGTITIADQHLENASIRADVGSVYFQGLLTGENTVQVGTGDITLRLHGAITDYSYSAETGVGLVQVGDRESAGMGGNMNQTLPSPLGTVNASAGIGAVTIEFGNFWTQG